jgi:hypothetical protein
MSNTADNNITSASPHIIERQMKQLQHRLRVLQELLRQSTQHTLWTHDIRCHRCNQIFILYRQDVSCPHRVKSTPYSSPHHCPPM